MTIWSPLRSLRQHLFFLGAALALAVGGLAAAGAAPAAAASGPCDIYASYGTPCVAAHSTTRALYASYDGPLYQVRRSSDNTTKNIYPVSAGSYANSATRLTGPGACGREPPSSYVPSFSIYIEYDL
jgi:non-reducing end alpha-L-arabinofuranosidase